MKSYSAEGAIPHIVHDYAYLASAGHDTQQPLPFPFNHYAERTFLVHCRAFADFFSDKIDDRDMHAREFVDGSYARILDAWTEWHNHIHRHLMHLSKSRVMNETPWTGEDNKAILEAFQNTWKCFYTALKPCLKPLLDDAIRDMQKEFPKLLL